MSELRIFTEKDFSDFKTRNISSDAIHIWLIKWRFLKENALLAKKIKNTLNEEEIERAYKYRSADDRNRSIISRGILRILGYEYTGKNEREIKIRAAHSGKPYFTGEESELHFNISHSGEYIALAFAPKKELGIDIERHNPNIDISALASFFSKEERKIIESSSDYRDFYDLWVCKEAFVKYTGEGLTRALDSFAVIGEEIMINGKVNKAHHLERIKMFPDYSAAIVF